MTHVSVRKRLLASSMITSAALAASAGVAFGQAAQTTAGGTGAPPASGATTVQEFVVTGSRIPQPNLTAASPVTVVSGQELKLEGTSRVEDLLNQLPQVVGDQGGFLSNGSTGTATINLRDLGAKRNLVLIDGTRLGPGDPGDPVADINFIPAALIDRIDVLTGGASAVYGADAVAGVVNFVMKKDFEGLQLDVNFGGYEHSNNNAKDEAANKAVDYTLPANTVFDGQTVDVSAIFGANSPDGKGNVEGYLEYRHIAAVPESQRDYSNCSIAVTGQNFSCGGSSTSRNGRLLVFDQYYNETGDFEFSGGGNLATFKGTPSQLYNYAPENYFQRNDQRYSGGFFAHYDITPHVTAYAKFMFMDDFTDAQIAESGDFGQTASIPCNDPLLSPTELQAICITPGYYNPALPNDGTATHAFILRRNVEGGPRVSENRHTDYRATVGLKGDIDANWHFDVYAQYYTTIDSAIEEDYFSNTKLVNALDVVPGPNGTPVCASGGACVPYNVFGYVPGGVTQAALNYLEVPGESTGETTEQVVSASVTGDLSSYGAKSPWAKDGVGVSFGTEYRREYLSTSPDEEEQSGDLAGGAGATPPIAGGFDVKEVFAEARIPLAQDMPFFKELTADAGYRFSHYSEAGNTTTYKIEGTWRPIDDVLIRGGFNRAVRAPNVDELYTTRSITLDGSVDPCANTTIAYTAAQCANTGVTAAQYGNIVPNTAAQYNGLTGGNPNLKPEKANTYTAGVVLTPKEFVKGMSISVDYFNIKITDVIQSYGFANIIDDCATTGNPTYCSLIHRQPGTGSLWLSPNGYIVDTLQNLGFLKTSGVDFTFDYRFSFRDVGLPDYGGLELNFVGTYTADFDIQGALGTPTNYCAGLYGPTCGIPLPYFKSKTRLTWTTPIQGFEASVAWRRTGSVNLDTGATGTADSHIPEYSYFDLSMQYRFKDRYTFRVGCNNLFDIDPPVIGSNEGGNNANTYPQIYDPLGRYIFMGVTADF